MMFICTRGHCRLPLMGLLQEGSTKGPSEQRDSNPRPPSPQDGTLPSCAMLRASTAPLYICCWLSDPGGNGWILQLLPIGLNVVHQESGEPATMTLFTTALFLCSSSQHNLFLCFQGMHHPCPDKGAPYPGPSNSNLRLVPHHKNPTQDHLGTWHQARHTRYIVEPTRLHT